MHRLFVMLGFMDRWSIRARLVFSFMLLIAMAVALGLGSVVMLGKVKSASDELANKWMPSIRHLLSITVITSTSQCKCKGKAAHWENSWSNIFNKKLL
jgi:hypothetical protein